MDWAAEFATGENNSVIARRLSLRPSAVRLQRMRLGLPASTAKRSCNPDWSLADGLMGTMSDGEIAKLLKVSRPTIHARRIQIGVPAFTRLGWNRPVQVVTDKVENKAGVCECGNSKSQGSIACYRCEKLDGVDSDADLIAELRVEGTMTVGRVAEVLGCSEEGALAMAKRLMDRGRVRAEMSDEYDAVVYRLAFDYFRK